MLVQTCFSDFEWCIRILTIYTKFEFSAAPSPFLFQGIWSAVKYLIWFPL